MSHTKIGTCHRLRCRPQAQRGTEGRTVRSSNAPDHRRTRWGTVGFRQDRVPTSATDFFHFIWKSRALAAPTAGTRRKDLTGRQSPEWIFFLTTGNGASENVHGRHFKVMLYFTNKKLDFVVYGRFTCHWIERISSKRIHYLFEIGKCDQTRPLPSLELITYKQLTRFLVDILVENMLVSLGNSTAILCNALCRAFTAPSLLLSTRLSIL